MWFNHSFPYMNLFRERGILHISSRYIKNFDFDTLALKIVMMILPPCFVISNWRSIVTNNLVYFFKTLLESGHNFSWPDPLAKPRICNAFP